MDVQTTLICVGFIVISGAVLLIASMLGIKEKTYEEAIAEQRKMPDDALLFRRPHKTKSKDKKSQQRSGKKVKEKKKEVKQLPSDELEELVSITPEPEPVHVKIIPEPEVLGETAKPEIIKKKKKDKIKPILVHKEEPVFDEPSIPPALANHFDLIQPKDDLTLRKLSRGDADEPKIEPEKPQVEPKSEKSVVPVSASSTPADSSPVQQNKSKEKKKNKKQDFNAALQTPVTVQVLSSLILKAALSPNERQILTDLLLNDYQDGHSEWSEDMQMLKLKKQLAEKEEALTNEIASSQTFQSKLRELRNELNEEKVKCRQYEEGMMSKLNEYQTLQAQMLQQTHKRQNMVKEMQALQVKINEDTMVIRSLQDSNQSQVALQQEILTYRQQISQMDVHMTRLSETESNLKAQLHALSTTCAAEQQKNRVLEDELRDASGKLEALKENNTTRQELIRKLEETERDRKKSEDDLAHEKNRHASEVKMIKFEADKVLEYEQSRLHGEINTLINKMSYLQADAEKQKSIVEQVKLEADRQKTERDKLVEDVKKLQNECERLQTELTAATSERTAGDGRENGGKDLNTDFINHEAESKNKDIILEKLQLDLESSGKVIEKLKSELNSVQTKLNSELKLCEERFKTEIKTLKEEIEIQKTKNNDLRQKNWKAMDALSSTEKALEKVLETEALANHLSAVARSEAQNESMALLTRLFPEVKVDNKDFKDWLVAFETSAQAALSSLRTVQSTPDDLEKVAELERQVTQLQGMVAHYKTIIEDTEGMLNRLQGHVEAEELRWRESLEIKQNEIDALKTDLTSLSSKVTEKDAVLEALRLEIDPFRKLADEAQGNLQVLCNERDSLKIQLASEQERLKEVNKELVKVRSNLKIGHDSFAAEQKLRIDLEEKLKAFTCKGGDNGEINVLATESVPVKLPPSSVDEAVIPKKKKKKKRAKNQGNQTWQNGGDPGN